MLLRSWRVARWIFVALGFAYIALVIYSYPHDHEARLAKAAVAKIEAQKLTMDDVSGNHLPPPPDASQVDATVAGVDANDNGVRDDVELAIFAKYSTSTAVRAAELQYAMELQNELTNVFDDQTWVAVSKSENDGISCLIDIAFDTYPDTKDQIRESQEWEKEVESLTFNTPARQAKRNQIEVYQSAYVVGEGHCDLFLHT